MSIPHIVHRVLEYPSKLSQNNAKYRSQHISDLFVSVFVVLLFRPIRDKTILTTVGKFSVHLG